MEVTADINAPTCMNDHCTRPFAPPFAVITPRKHLDQDDGGKYVTNITPRKNEILHKFPPRKIGIINFTPAVTDQHVVTGTTPQNNANDDYGVLVVVTGITSKKL